MAMAGRGTAHTSRERQGRDETCYSNETSGFVHTTTTTIFTACYQIQCPASTRGMKLWPVPPLNREGGKVKTKGIMIMKTERRVMSKGA